MSLTAHPSSNASSLFDTEKTWLQRDFGLDRRLIKALSKLRYTYPTLIQSKCLPIALQGKDILVRARTGSGKTVAFALPVLQKVLQLKESEADDEEGGGVKAIILAPTKELIKQIEKNMQDLIYYCRDVVSVCSLLEDNAKVVEYRLQAKPDVLLSTPAKLAQLLQQGKKELLQLGQASMLVIDEADLVLSFGYKQDVNTVVAAMPKIFQGIFMSATLSADLDKFKRLVLHNPVILKLEEEKSAGNLLQFYLESTEQDKYLVLYVFLKLGLLQGKGLIFVNDVNKCYRLKLFLQQFYINSAVLNAEVPTNSRTHILEEFNRGVFDYLIATDATVDRGDDEEDDSDEDEEGEGEEKAQDVDVDGEEEDGEEGEGEEQDGEDDEEEEEDGEEGEDEEGEDDEDEDDAAEEQAAAEEISEKPAAKKSKKAKKYEKVAEKDEYGVSRGIDFTGVNFVVNFDFPVTTAAYTHRIGRTARGMASGTALSFVAKEEIHREQTKDAEVARRDHEVLHEVRQKQPRLGVVEGDNVLAAIGATGGDIQSEEDRMQPAPLLFNTQELESFRYRVMDTLRSVTGAAVKELRTAEIRREVLNSEKLKSYFAENPNDLKVLRHDKAILHPIKQKEHLKFVPDYLIPATMKSVAQMNPKKNNKRKNDRQSQESRMKRSKMNDPLYSGGDNAATNTTTTNNNNDTSTYGKGASGRKDWKERHKKGEFNPKMKQRNSTMTAGTFMKSKKKFNR